MDQAQVPHPAFAAGLLGNETIARLSRSNTKRLTRVNKGEANPIDRVCMVKYPQMVELVAIELYCRFIFSVKNSFTRVQLFRFADQRRLSNTRAHDRT
jgi:hypothetical protein